MNEFTKIAHDYDKGRSGEDVIFWAGETKELARLDEESIILDMGCGTGIYTVGLKDHTSATTCGLDPSVGMLSARAEGHVRGNLTGFTSGTGRHPGTDGTHPPPQGSTPPA